MRHESSKEIIKHLTGEGWYLARIKGSHYQFKLAEEKGVVTVQHPKNIIYGNTLRSIYRQTGWQW